MGAYLHDFSERRVVMAKGSVKAIPISIFNAAGLTNVAQPINPNGLEQACFLIRIVNGSNLTIGISYDQLDDHDVLLPDTSLQLPLQSNSSPNGYVCQLAKGKVIYLT